MNLLPDEANLRFDHFGEPSAVFRTDRSRVVGAWVLVVILVVMALAFVGIAAMFLSDPNQINKPLLAAVCGSFTLGWLVMAWWILRRLGRFGKQRVLVYPEGIATWQNGKFHPLRWEQILSLDRVDKQITQGALERWAYVGKDLEFRMTTDAGEDLILNAMLLDVEELGSHLHRGFANSR